MSNILSQIAQGNKGQQADPIGSYKQGFDIGTGITNAPIDTAQKKATLETNQFALATAKVKSLQDAAVNLDNNNWGITRNLLVSHGVIKPEDMPEQPDMNWKTGTINKLANAATQLDLQSKRSEIGYKQAQTDQLNMFTGKGIFNTPMGPVPVAGFNITPNQPTPPAPNTQNIETRPAEISQALGIPSEKLNPVQIRAQRMIDGLEDMSKVSTSRDPAGYAAALLARQIAPDVSQTAYEKRQKTVDAFGPGGKLGASVVNLNTAAQHLEEMVQDYAALNNASNADSIAPSIRNTIGNKITNIGNSAPLTDFNNTVSKFSDELQSAYVPGGGSAHERGANKEDYPSNASPEAQQEHFRTAADLLIGKIEGLEHARRAGYGRVVPPSDLYTPETLEILGKYASPNMAKKLEKYGYQPKEQIPTGSNINASAGTAKQGGLKIPPMDAVKHLIANPALAPAFDEKYGAGASKQVLGK